MWILIFLFGISTLGLGWVCFGYYIFVWFVGLFKKEAKAPLNSMELPFLSVVIPCFNEAENILDKLNNIKEQDYPHEKLEIIFADGGSEDNTVNIIENNIIGLPNFKLLKCPQRGKINQLNYALSQARGEIVVNTDVDGMMEKDCLTKIVEEFKVNKDIAVVSAYSLPKNVSNVDTYYWLSQNRGRVLETKAYTSSIAIAVCYAFRKELLNVFPEDVVADDIYVAYLANTLGYRTKYSVKARAFEIRGAKNTEEFIPHKFRKSNAFLKEALRFLYRIPEMPRLWQLMYITKLSQLLFIPWAILSWVVLAVALLSLYRYDVVILGLLFLLVTLLIANRIFKRVGIEGENEKYPLYVVIKAFILSNLILIATGLSYPFYRQDSNYKRIGKR